MGKVIRFPVDQLRLGLPAEEVQQKPAPARPVEPKVCWACGVNKPLGRESYCRSCIKKGLDTPIISCRGEGCTYVTKRIWRGQQFFYCHEHRSTR